MLFTRGPRVPRHRREQGSRPGGRLAPPRWWVSKPVCIALDQAILLSFARRELPFSAEKWRSALPTLSAAVRCVCSVRLQITEQNIINWPLWIMQVRQAFQSHRRRRHLLQEGVGS